MPISFEIQRRARAVYSRCTGVVTLQDVLQYETDVVKDPDFDPAFAELVDLSAAETLDLSFEKVATVIAYERTHERYVGARKTAFVAPKDLEFGLTRMYETMAKESPMETQVFRTLDAACEWLDLLPEDLGLSV